jgi:hypothetical protein
VYRAGWFLSVCLSTWSCICSKTPRKACARIVTRAESIGYKIQQLRGWYIAPRWPAHCLRLLQSIDSRLECHDGRDHGRPFRWTRKSYQLCDILAKWSAHRLRLLRSIDLHLECHGKKLRMTCIRRPRLPIIPCDSGRNLR